MAIPSAAVRDYVMISCWLLVQCTRHLSWHHTLFHRYPHLLIYCKLTISLTANVVGDFLSWECAGLALAVKVGLKILPSHGWTWAARAGACPVLSTAWGEVPFGASPHDGCRSWTHPRSGGHKVPASYYSCSAQCFTPAQAFVFIGLRGSEATFALLDPCAQMLWLSALLDPSKASLASNLGADGHS